MSAPAPDLAPLPELLTAGELNKETKILVPRIYQLCREGLIPHVRIGRSIRFSRQEVAGWLAAGGTASGEKSER